MLRVAVPNKGALSEPAREMLREGGYLSTANARDLVVVDDMDDAIFRQWVHGEAAKKKNADRCRRNFSRPTTDRRAPR